jgi:hypothetical protein
VEHHRIRSAAARGYDRLDSPDHVGWWCATGSSTSNISATVDLALDALTFTVVIEQQRRLVHEAGEILGGSWRSRRSSGVIGRVPGPP